MIKRKGLITRFFDWIFEPVGDIAEIVTDSIAEKVSKKIKDNEGQEDDTR